MKNIFDFASLMRLERLGKASHRGKKWEKAKENATMNTSPIEISPSNDEGV